MKTTGCARSSLGVFWFAELVTPVNVLYGNKVGGRGKVGGGGGGQEVSREERKRSN